MNPKPGPIRAYLKELRDGNLPVDASRIETFGVPDHVVLNPASEMANAEAFFEIMKNCLDKLDASKRILISNFLFTKGSSTDCAQAARKELEANKLNSSENYYRNNLRAALDNYAVAIGKELSSLESKPHDGIPAPPLTPAWYDVIEIEWFLRLDKQDYRRQSWVRSIKVRSRTVDQPLIVIPQNWSGKGHREGDVNVLSGPPKDDPHSHQCLRVRPESDDPNSWELYIFDLGQPLLPGKEEVLQFAETLVDDEDDFSPYIWQSTARYPMLERVTFILDIPTELGVDKLEAYREVPTPHTGIGFAPVLPMAKVSRDTDGLFRHIVTDIDHQSRYRVVWEPQYRKL